MYFLLKLLPVGVGRPLSAVVIHELARQQRDGRESRVQRLYFHIWSFTNVELIVHVLSILLEH